MIRVKPVPLAVKPLAAEAIAGWTRHNGTRLGASLAFYALLSLTPLVLVAISIAGLVLGSQAAHAGVMQQLEMLFGVDRAHIIEALLEGAQSREGGFAATALGMITLLFGASGLLSDLRSSLNTIWDVPARKTSIMEDINAMIKDRLWSFALVLGIGVLLTCLVTVSTWVSAAGRFYASVLPLPELALHVIGVSFSFLVVTALFAAVYKIVPAAAIQWSDVVLGAAVTSALLTTGNLLLGLYLGKASFSSTYGAAASSVVFLLWVYYSGQIFFLGAEFTRAFAKRYGSRIAQ